jgi:hypothetical protein
MLNSANIKVTRKIKYRPRILQNVLLLLERRNSNVDFEREKNCEAILNDLDPNGCLVDSVRIVLIRVDPEPDDVQQDDPKRAIPKAVIRRDAHVPTLLLVEVPHVVA